jgi:hypothetical protein
LQFAVLSVIAVAYLEMQLGNPNFEALPHERHSGWLLRFFASAKCTGTTLFWAHERALNSVSYLLILLEKDMLIECCYFCGNVVGMMKSSSAAQR